LSRNPLAPPPTDSRDHDAAGTHSDNEEQPRLLSRGFLVVLTLLGLAIIAAVIGMMILAWIAEGDDPFALNGDANIGLGLLLLAVLLNVPIWSCWISTWIRDGRPFCWP
jgi:hypothetical protein